MSETFTVEKTVHFQARGRHKALCLGSEPAETPEPVPRVPRLARLMALAIRCETLLRSGEIKDLAELARLGHVTRARMSQIVSLVHLAPDIQEEILFLADQPRGPGATLLADLQPIAAIADWAKQRRRWQTLRRRSSEPNRVAP